MRVKHRYLKMKEFTVMDESNEYYIVRDDEGQSIALDKREWEPAERWYDKTAEHDGEQAVMLLTTDPIHYRLVQHTIEDLQSDRKYKAYLLERNGGL